MGSKPEPDPELMSCQKPRRRKAAPRWIGWFMTVTTLGVLGLVTHAERQRSIPGMPGMRNTPSRQFGPTAPWQAPLLPSFDRSIIVAPRGIDEAMIKTARQGIDEAMIVNPTQVQGTLMPIVPVPTPGVPGVAPLSPWQPSPGVPQPHR